MSVYNGEQFLDLAIESVLAQTFSDFEFLILDDGSTDRSRAIVERHAAVDSRIRLISRENRGLIASLNQLLEEAKAPLIARMDADDICLPHRFECQHAFLQAHADYGVVGSAAEDIDEHGEHYPAPDYTPPETHDAVLDMIERHPPLCHSSVMARRDVLLAAGGYHQAFRHCEDYDLWLRLANRTKIGNIKEHLIRYRRYEGQVSAKFSLEQSVGAAIAVVAFRERSAGRPDPTEHLVQLPPIEQLDNLFGRDGISTQVRSRVAQGVLYSRTALSGDGFRLVIDHLRGGGHREGMWRTVARLMRFGEPLRAMALAATLVTC